MSVLVPLEWLAVVWLYHWYVRVPPPVTEALTLKVTVPPTVTEFVAAGCVPIVGGAAFKVIVATLLVAVAVPPL